MTDFALSIVAVRADLQGESSRVDMRHQALVVSAESEGEAKHAGLAHALGLWPTSEGYAGHSVSVALNHQEYSPVLTDSVTERIM